MTAVVAQHNGLLPFGWLGVWLFFVISGYVVTASVINRGSEALTWQGCLHFFRRRARRILPAYYGYLALGLALCTFVGVGTDLFAVLSLFGFYNNVAMALGRGELTSWPVGHLWTISVEMQFYAVYGVLLVIAARRTLVLVLLCSLFAAPAIRYAASTFISGLERDSLFNAYAIYSGSFLHTDSFATGALVAFAARNGILARIARPLALIGGMAFGGYATIYVILNFAGGERGVDIFRNVVSGIVWGQFREVFLYSAVAAASGGLVALAVVKDPIVYWALKSQVFHRIGEISYGAYIYHGVAIWMSTLLMEEYLSAPGDEWTVGARIVRFLLSYTLTIAAAEMSYRFLETRFMTHSRQQRTQHDPARAYKAADT